MLHKQEVSQEGGQGVKDRGVISWDEGSHRSANLEGKIVNSVREVLNCQHAAGWASDI